MKRRTACLVLCVCLLLCLALPVGASDGAEFSDRGEIRNVGAVQMLVDLGLISGYSDGSFRPASYITREEVAKLIAILCTENPQAPADVYFYDAQNSWALTYIGYCAGQGIIAGDGMGSFRPKDNVTAQELAKMLLVNLCISLGWRGGSIFPLIFSGVAAGYAFAAITGIDPNFAVAAMTAGLYGYVSRKPVMTVAVLLMCFPPVYIFPLAGAAVIASKVPIPPKMHEEEKNCR